MFSEFCWKQWTAMIVFAVLMASCAASPVSAAEKNENQYRVEVDWDRDLQIIEFTPKANKDYICVALKQGYAGGLSCFPKKEKK